MTPRVAVVTGATGALGQAVAARLGRDHALVLLARHAGAAPPGGLSLAADVTSDDAMAEAARQIAARFGRIDALVHVAGGFEMGEPVHGLSRASWDRLMALNAWSFATVTRHLLPLMAAVTGGGTGGRVVAVSAAGAAHGAAHQGAYAASEAALQRLVESLAAERRADGIRVNSVAPTVLDTPDNRAAMPDADRAAWVPLDAAADAIAFLAGDASRAVNGQHLTLG